MDLDRFFVSIETDRLASPDANAQSGGHRAHASQASGGERLKERREGPIELGANISVAVFNLVKLLLEGDRSLGKEAQAAILLAERDEAVFEQFLNDLADFVSEGGG